MSSSLDSTLGATYIGIALSHIMYGITCLQAYLYFTEHCGGDHRLIKTFVGLVMTADTVQTATLAISGYHYTITNFGNFDELTRATWSLTCEFIVGSPMSSAIQIFFAWRIYHLTSKRLIIPACIVVISLIKMGFSIAFAVQATGKPLPFSTPLDIALTVPAYILDIIADISIAATMAYYLKSQSYVKRTKRAIKLLVIYTMNTCFLTSVFSLIAVIIYIVTPTTFIFVPFYCIFIRSYVCSLLCLLNSRDRIRQELQGTGEVITLSAIAPQNPAASATSIDAADHSRGGGGYNTTVLPQQLVERYYIAKDDV